jgi:membrane protein DedA with SNARE-associated domain
LWISFENLIHTLEVFVLDNFLIIARMFITGQPVFFVIVMGLIVAVISVAGEIATYWAARLGGRPLVERLRKRGWLKGDEKRTDRAEELFARWGVRLVIFGRIIPGIRTLVSIPAGLTRMNFGLFAGAAFSGAYVWNTLLVGIGYTLGFKVTLLGISILG